MIILFERPLKTIIMPKRQSLTQNNYQTQIQLLLDVFCMCVHDCVYIANVSISFCLPFFCVRYVFVLVRDRAPRCCAPLLVGTHVARACITHGACLAHALPDAHTCRHVAHTQMHTRVHTFTCACATSCGHTPSHTHAGSTTPPGTRTYASGRARIYAWLW